MTLFQTIGASISSDFDAVQRVTGAPSTQNNSWPENCPSPFNGISALHFHGLMLFFTTGTTNTKYKIQAIIDDIDTRCAPCAIRARAAPCSCEGDTQQQQHVRPPIAQVAGARGGARGRCSAPPPLQRTRFIGQESARHGQRAGFIRTRSLKPCGSCIPDRCAISFFLLIDVLVSLTLQPPSLPEASFSASSSSRFRVDPHATAARCAPAVTSLPDLRQICQDFQAARSFLVFLFRCIRWPFRSTPRPLPSNIIYKYNFKDYFT